MLIKVLIFFFFNKVIKIFFFWKIRVKNTLGNFTHLPRFFYIGWTDVGFKMNLDCIILQTNPESESEIKCPVKPHWERDLAGSRCTTAAVAAQKGHACQGQIPRFGNLPQHGPRVYSISYSVQPKVFFKVFNLTQKRLTLQSDSFRCMQPEDSLPPRVMNPNLTDSDDGK